MAGKTIVKPIDIAKGARKHLFKKQPKPSKEIAELNALISFEKEMKDVIKENYLSYRETERSTNPEVKTALEQKAKRKQAVALMSDLSDVLESGEIITRTNPVLDGEVRVKRGGMNEGLVHLIDHRIRERVLNKHVQMDTKQAQKETSAILFLAIDNIDKVPAVKEANGHYAVYNKGIKTVIGKDSHGRYVVTGYDNKQTEKEATESINAVIAQYGRTPEFLGIYAQVGAVIASQNILPQQKNLSSVMYEHAEIEVDGKMRECKHGLLAGFKNAVSRIEIQNKTIERLSRENEKLRDQLQKDRTRAADALSFE